MSVSIFLLSMLIVCKFDFTKCFKPNASYLLYCLCTCCNNVLGSPEVCGIQLGNPSIHPFEASYFPANLKTQLGLFRLVGSKSSADKAGLSVWKCLSPPSSLEVWGQQNDHRSCGHCSKSPFVCACSGCRHKIHPGVRKPQCRTCRIR